MKTNSTASPSPSFPFLLAALTLLPATLGFGQQQYSFRPYEQRPGEVMTVRTKSSSATGTITITENDKEVDKGKMILDRERQFERSVSGTGANKQIRYKIISDVTKTTTEIGGKKTADSFDSSLTGETLLGDRDASNRWRFSLPDAVPSPAQAVELAQFDAHENSRLLPVQPVRLKESWDIDPGFLTHITERGIGPANVRARATLDSLEEQDGEKTAIITIIVETVATEGTSAEGRGAGATVKASGELHVSMESMLAKKLTLFGALTTVKVNGATRVRTHLPVQIEMTRQIR